MKHSLSLFKPTSLALGAALLVACGVGVAPAHARKASPRLQIWPGQRVLIVLPLQVDPNFLSPDSPGAPVSAPASAPAPAPAAAQPPAAVDTATTSAAAPTSPATTGAAPTVPSGATTPAAAPEVGTAPSAASVPLAVSAPPSGSDELRAALVPVVSDELSNALKRTGKFSLVAPYKFDPLLRRGLLESSVSDDDLNGFVATPTLATAQTVLSKLLLDQPGMVAQVTLESLQVGGTAKSPTVQVRMHGDLYQVPAATADQATPTAQVFRSITVTSQPFGGRSPEDRLRAASAQAFNDVAAAFVSPPEEFQLPIPVAPPEPVTDKSNHGKGKKGKGVPSNGDKGSAAANGGNATPAPAPNPAPATTPTAGGGNGQGPLAPVVVPVTPGQAPVAVPNPQTSGPGTPVAPTLPPATPPLGVNVPPAQ